MVNRDRADLAHFDRIFTRAADPWGTFALRAEAFKRRGIRHALGGRAIGRLLEPGCGNGSNTRMLARLALRVDACDGAPSAVLRTAQSTKDLSGVHVHHLPLPGRFPGRCFDAIVVAELLYYLDTPTLTRVRREIERSLRPGGVLLLCHHHRQFHDAAQRQAGLHRRFIAASPFKWRVLRKMRTARWELHLLSRHAGPRPAQPVKGRRSCASSPRRSAS